MNFEFRVGDFVEWKKMPGVRLELVREFVAGIFHAKREDGTLFRVRSADLSVRLRRPSEEIERKKIDERKARKQEELRVRKDRVEKNRKEFAHLSAYKIRLTADGLPDQRCKPRYDAKTSPKSIKPRSRSNLL